MERTKLFFDVFVTAMEGGVNYWAFIKKYKWTGSDGSYDLHHFHSVITEEETDRTWHVNHEVIAKGFRIAMNPETRIADWMRGLIINAYYNPDTADFDVEVADVIVQLGLLGEVVYG